MPGSDRGVPGMCLKLTRTRLKCAWKGLESDWNLSGSDKDKAEICLEVSEMWKLLGSAWNVPGSD